MDGIYLTADELLLDGNGTAVNVADMTGNVRDDGAQFTSYSTSSSVSQVLTDQGYNATDILGSNEFLTPHGANSTFDIFNLTSQFATDAIFRCLMQFTVYSPVSNDVFLVVYSYEIDRDFQISEWSPSPLTGEAPIILTTRTETRCAVLSLSQRQALSCL